MKHHEDDPVTNGPWMIKITVKKITTNDFIKVLSLRTLALVNGIFCTQP